MSAIDNIQIEIPKNAKRIYHNQCIVCDKGKNEKNVFKGCYHWGQKVSDRHQYWSYSTKK